MPASLPPLKTICRVAAGLLTLGTLGLGTLALGILSVSAQEASVRVPNFWDPKAVHDRPNAIPDKIQFLATEYAPETAYSYGSPSSVLWNWLTTNLPYKLSPLAAAVLVLWGLTKRWWMAPLVLGLAICVDALGTQLIAFIIEQTTGESKGGILGDSHSSRWLYVGGRTFTLWGAFAVARLLNVRPFFGGEKTDSE